MTDAPHRLLLRRYGLAARWYDVVSMEPLLYRRGRVAVIEALTLQPGERVLDIGTGTGLSLPLLADAVGDSGAVVGLDPSNQMLTQARARIESSPWGGRVRLVSGTASTPTAELGRDFDVALFAYSLGVMDDWRQAWDAAVARVVPGGRIGVLDTDWPGGGWKLLAPAAAVALAAGGVHPDRQVWRHAAEALEHPMTRTLKGRHVRFTVGSVPSRRP